MTISPHEAPVPASRTAEAPLPDVISAEQMDELVRNGGAYQWDIPLEGEMPLVTLVDGVWVETEDGWILQSGEWYSVFVDRQDGAYERVNDDSATVYTDFCARLRAADQTVAQHQVVDGEIVQDGDAAAYPIELEPAQPPGPDGPSPR